MRKTPQKIVDRIGELVSEGRTVSEIAKITGLSSPTVRTILAENFAIIPELRRALENIHVPWRFKRMEVGKEEIIGDRRSVLIAIDVAKKLNDVLFTEKFNRRWVVVVNKELNIVSIKRTL